MSLRTLTALLPTNPFKIGIQLTKRFSKHALLKT